MTPPTAGAALEPAARSVELAPDLPMPAYHAYERWCPDRVGALALYCSDGRWGGAFDEFCHRHLQIPHYDRWAAPGGPAWLAHPEEGMLQAARAQLDFLVRAHQLERVVLIAHYGCAWYGHRTGRPERAYLAEQLADLRRAAERLRAWYADLRVEGYLAMRQNTWVTFHRVEA
jgi:hypothetical protein